MRSSRATDSVGLAAFTSINSNNNTNMSSNPKLKRMPDQPTQQLHHQSKPNLLLDEFMHQQAQSNPIININSPRADPTVVNSQSMNATPSFLFKTRSVRSSLDIAANQPTKLFGFNVSSSDQNANHQNSNSSSATTTAAAAASLKQKKKLFLQPLQIDEINSLYNPKALIGAATASGSGASSSVRAFEKRPAFSRKSSSSSQSTSHLLNSNQNSNNNEDNTTKSTAAAFTTSEPTLSDKRNLQQLQQQQQLLLQQQQMIPSMQSSQRKLMHRKSQSSAILPLAAISSTKNSSSNDPNNNNNDFTGLLPSANMVGKSSSRYNSGGLSGNAAAAAGGNNAILPSSSPSRTLHYPNGTIQMKLSLQVPQASSRIKNPSSNIQSKSVTATNATASAPSTTPTKLEASQSGFFSKQQQQQHSNSQSGIENSGMTIFAGGLEGTQQRPPTNSNSNGPISPASGSGSTAQGYFGSNVIDTNNMNNQSKQQYSNSISSPRLDFQSNENKQTQQASTTMASSTRKYVLSGAKFESKKQSLSSLAKPNRDETEAIQQQQQASTKESMNQQQQQQAGVSFNPVRFDSRSLQGKQQSTPAFSFVTQQKRESDYSQPNSDSKNVVVTNSTAGNQREPFNSQQSAQQSTKQQQQQQPSSQKLHPERPYLLANLHKAMRSPQMNDPFSRLVREHFTQTCQGIVFSNFAKAANPHDLAAKKVVLGPRNPKFRKTIVFDLDETLIHCNVNPMIASDFTVDLHFPTGENIKAGINVRPFAVEILKSLSKDFEIVIFTASHSVYAQAVIDRLDPTGQHVHHRFFRETCIQSATGVYMKDLRVFSDRKLSEIVLVDNAAYSFCFQVDNGIPIVPYYDGRTDDELTHLMSYINQLNNVADVREYNRQHLKLFLFNNQLGPKKVHHDLFNSKDTHKQ